MSSSSMSMPAPIIKRWNKPDRLNWPSLPWWRFDPQDQQQEPWFRDHAGLLLFYLPSEKNNFLIMTYPSPFFSTYLTEVLWEKMSTLCHSNTGSGSTLSFTSCTTSLRMLSMRSQFSIKGLAYQILSSAPRFIVQGSGVKYTNIQRIKCIVQFRNRLCG